MCLSCLVVFLLVAQPDTSHLRISLLTCSPGVELYSTFGHTALRVTDSARGVDMAYNYGTFDDRDPNFYAKFTRGIMLYALSNYSYQEFLQEYQYEHRGVIEQELQLTGEQKQRHVCRPAGKCPGNKTGTTTIISIPITVLPAPAI